MTVPRRHRIGVLIEIVAGTEWAPHGLSRLMGFLVQGAATSGKVRFDLLVPSYAKARVEEDLRELDAIEGRDWTVLSPPEPLHPLIRLAERQLVGGRFRNDNGAYWQWGGYANSQSSAIGSAARANAGRLPAPVAVLLRRAWRLLMRFNRGLNILPSAMRTYLRAWLRPRFLTQQALVLDRLADFAAKLPDIEGWLAFTPDSAASFRLPSPKAALVAGMGARIFPDGSPPEWVTASKAQIHRLASEMPGIITFSHHVAQADVIEPSGTDPARVHAIHHAPVDLARDLAFLPHDRRPTISSRTQAAGLLRRHAHERGWDYLNGFPFEDVDYLVVSTQDRPYKNLIVIAQAAQRLIQRDRRPIKVFMTARLPSPDQSPTARLIEEYGLGFDIVTMPLLPRDVHAALYHCALASVHPSLWEGGTGAFPLDEANSLGVPGLVADSPSMREFVRYNGMADCVFPPHDADELVRMIHHIADHRNDVRDSQLAVYQRRQQERTWAMVADAYTAAVLNPTGEPA